MAPVAVDFYFLWSLARTYRKLPGQVPVHFGFDGSPNGYMPRALWAVFSVLLTVGLTAFLLFIVPPDIWTVPTILFWAATGMVAGVFSEINFSAAARRRMHLISLLWGAVIVTAAGILCTLALAPWWRVPR